jgi:hypothetical protein
MSQAALKPQPVERRRDGNAEARIQAAVVEWIRWCAPQVVVFAIPNGGLRGKAEAARLRWTGVLAGIPDLAVLAPVGKVFFLEVKAPDGGLSAEQREMFHQLVALGIDAAIVRSVQDVRMAFREWGIETREARAV